MKKYLAHKFSGATASLFAGSIVLELFKNYNAIFRFKIPFYALTFDLKRNWLNEWVKGYEVIADEVEKVINQEGLDYFQKIAKEIVKYSKAFKNQAQITLKRIKNLSDFDLISEFQVFCHDYVFYFAWGVITFPYESIISERLTSRLLLKNASFTDNLSSLLSSKYKNFMNQSDELLSKINKSKGAKQEKLIKQYLSDFFFIDTNYERANVLNKKTVIKMAQDAKSVTKPQAKTNKQNKLRLSLEEKKLIELLKITEVIRDQRKYINLLGSYTMFRFLDEAVRRTQFPLTIAKKMFWFEFKDLFYKRSLLLKRLKGRETGTILLDGDQYIYSDQILVAERKKDKELKLIKGTPASAGRAKGKVRLVFGPKDFPQFKPGEILVTAATRPEFVPIMKKAAAIVTDEGGLVSHAAIVSREFGIPCVVGTKVGTSLLKSGDLVEVDANKGIIRRRIQ